MFGACLERIANFLYIRSKLKVCISKKPLEYIFLIFITIYCSNVVFLKPIDLYYNPTNMAILKRTLCEALWVFMAGIVQCKNFFLGKEFGRTVHESFFSGKLTVHEIFSHNFPCMILLYTLLTCATPITFVMVHP